MIQKWCGDAEGLYESMDSQVIEHKGITVTRESHWWNHGGNNGGGDDDEVDTISE